MSFASLHYNKGTRYNFDMGGGQFLSGTFHHKSYLSPEGFFDQFPNVFTSAFFDNVKSITDGVLDTTSELLRNAVNFEDYIELVNWEHDFDDDEGAHLKHIDSVIFNEDSFWNAPVLSIPRSDRGIKDDARTIRRQEKHVDKHRTMSRPLLQFTNAVPALVNAQQNESKKPRFAVTPSESLSYLPGEGTQNRFLNSLHLPPGITNHIYSYLQNDRRKQNPSRMGGFKSHRMQNVPIKKRKRLTRRKQN